LRQSYDPGADPGEVGLQLHEREPEQFVRNVYFVDQSRLDLTLVECFRQLDHASD
jgi:hypothetical protein